MSEETATTTALEGTETVSSEQQGQPMVFPGGFSIDADGNFHGDLRTSNLIPEQYRDSKLVDKYKSFQGMFGGLAEAQRMTGMDKEGFAIVPNENTSPEDAAKFWEKVGKPSTPEGYEFKAPEGTPEGEWNTELDELFAKTAHDIQLPKQQASQLRNWFNDDLMPMLEKEQHDALQAKIDAREEAIQQDPKLGGHNLEQTVAIGNQAIGAIRDEFGLDPESVEYKDLLQAVNTIPTLYRLIIERGMGMQEGAIRGLDGGIQPASESIDEQIASTQKEMAALGNNAQFNNEAEWNRLQKKMTRLHQKKAGGR